MRLRHLVPGLGLAAFALFATLPGHAASIAFSNPSCNSFTFSDLGSGTFSVSCNLPSVPVCTLAASTTTPTIGTPVALTATCSDSPFGWIWTGTAASCGTSSSKCNDTQTAAGPKTYTVFAGNSVGRGPIASVTVNWSQPTNPPSGCTVTRTTPSNGTLPTGGGSITLTASCSGGSQPTSWNWRKNGQATAITSSTYSETLPANTQNAATTYSYDAQACIGTTCTPFTAPVTTVVVGGVAPVGFCGQYSDVRFIDLIWGSHVDTSASVTINSGTVLVGRLVVPASATSPIDGPGLLSVVEFQGPTADRLMSISTQSCDFRGYVPGSNHPAADPSGANGPLAWAAGVTTSNQFLLAGDPPGMFPVKPLLTPGQTYYVNLRTIIFGTGQNSCWTGNCDVRITVNPPR